MYQYCFSEYKRLVSPEVRLLSTGAGHDRIRCRPASARVWAWPDRTPDEGRERNGPPSVSMIMSEECRASNAPGALPRLVQRLPATPAAARRWLFSRPKGLLF